MRKFNKTEKLIKDLNENCLNNLFSSDAKKFLNIDKILDNGFINLENEIPNDKALQIYISDLIKQGKTKKLKYNKLATNEKYEDVQLCFERIFEPILTICDEFVYEFVGCDIDIYEMDNFSENDFRVEYYDKLLENIIEINNYFKFRNHSLLIQKFVKIDSNIKEYKLIPIITQYIN